MKLLTEAAEIEELASVLEQQSKIAVDTEFIRESTYFPQIELIQIATCEASWIVDARFFKKGHPPQNPKAYHPALEPLLKVFLNPNILKVLHAAQADQECLYWSFGVLPSPIIDTAVGASLCGFGQSIGLSRALQELLGVSLQKGHARTQWGARPLGLQLLEYAHGDVIHLLPLWEALEKRLELLKRKEWALEQSAVWAQPEKFVFPLEEIAQKASRRGSLDRAGTHTFLGLLQWREQRAQQLNLPRRWLAEDSVLLDLAQVRPQTFEHLASFRGLNRGELQKQGEELLKLIQKTASMKHLFPWESVPPTRKAGSTYALPRVQRLSGEEEDQIQNLVSCWIQIQAQKHRISPTQLLSSQQILEILRFLPFKTEISDPTEELWLSLLQEYLSPLVFDLIGRELVLFLLGRTAIVLNHTQPEVISRHV